MDMIEGDVPWAIDNKYYTANVTFEPRSLGVMATQTGAGWPVLIYVFAGQVSASNSSLYSGRIAHHWQVIHDTFYRSLILGAPLTFRRGCFYG